MICHSEAETTAWAEAFANRLMPGHTVLLSGPMGAGKSVVARAIGHALGVTGPMTSPTFTILNLYEGRMPVCHFDLYRLSGEDELYAAGLEEYLPPRDGIAVVEWPECAEDAMPENAIRVRIIPLDENTRDIVLDNDIPSEKEEAY